MAVTDFFAGEIATELLKMLLTITTKAILFKKSAEHLYKTVNQLLPIITEIKYSGVELPGPRQMQLDKISQTLNEGRELATKVLNSSRWNVYKNHQLLRKMDKTEKKISRFLQGPIQAHVLADVHHLRVEANERFDRIEGSARRLERRLGSMKLAWNDDEYGAEEMFEGNLVNVGMQLGLRKVKDMILDDDHNSFKVFGINGIGGSGKTTLVKEICRDNEVRRYYNNKILVLTVSQCPNVEELRQKILGFVSKSKFNGYSNMNIASQWTLQFNNNNNNWNMVVPILIVLDDVWSLEVLQQLIYKVPGCKTVVVSRIKFQSLMLNSTYELELLREEDAISLFCHNAFGTTSIPSGVDRNMIKQIVEKCKGLPLALKVIGASLRDQPEKYWEAAKNRLSKAQPICDSHENELLNRMKLSVDCLSDQKVRDCFLDLGAFVEDKNIPLDVLVNMWTELHDIDEEDAFAILVELSNKNLITLVKHSRAGDMYGSYYEISVSQHDVLRDLAIYMSNFESVNQRKRLVMARRENGVPKEWERNADEPFLARIVSVHTGEMREMDWFKMEFPKAEVLILNFDSTDYFLPPFIENMPKLRALVLINYSKTAQLHNISVLGTLTNLRSLWFEKVTIPHLPKKSISPLTNVQKLSLHLCKINFKDETELDLCYLFPCLTELTMDHCVEMTKLPSSVCQLKSLKSLSITNCESFEELPFDFGKLIFLHILRVYACPKLKTLPYGIKDLVWLQHINVSQCVSLHSLNEEIGGCLSLKEIDMHECPQIKMLPKCVSSLRSLRRVICDEEISWQWKGMEKELSSLCVQVAEQRYDLDWLKE
ncbi:probable disease resistance protein At4g33300 [Rutidosis leptorrhynchoides]|uniref:probable disease resistance protein At4g33300 n=1 Tax=Rutidosis leptorrhynchoides TaxID=125765 RepID=UPI003A9A14F0